MAKSPHVSRGIDFEEELTGSREEITAALRDIVDGIPTGAIRVGDGGDGVSVDVSDEISLEIELVAEDDELSLELELEWTAPDEDSTPQSNRTRPGETIEKPADVEASDTSQAVARFEVFRDRAGEWRWRLRHRNGNVIAVSGEGYTRKHNARKGLRSVMENSSAAVMSEESMD